MIGVLGGLIGLGGAEFRLPYLVGVLGLSVRQAVPVNLAISLATVLAAFPARLLAAAPSDLAAFAPEAVALAAGAVVAAFLGAGWLRHLSDQHRRSKDACSHQEGWANIHHSPAQGGHHSVAKPPAVSKHLAVLKRTGLVLDRHEGRQTHYSAQVQALAPLIDWTSRMTAFWEARFAALEDLLKRMDQ